MTYIKEYEAWDGTHDGIDRILVWIKGLTEKGVDVSDLRIKGSCDLFHANCCVLEFNGTPVEEGDRIVYREFTGFYLLKNPAPLAFDDPEDAFHISDRGWCYSSSKWKLPEGFWEPWDLAGYPASINGTPVTIRGIDAFCSARSPKSPYRGSFAVLVSDEDAERIDYEPHRSRNRS